MQNSIFFKSKLWYLSLKSCWIFLASDRRLLLNWYTFFAERWHTLVWECGALCKHVHEIYYGKGTLKLSTRGVEKYLNKPIKLSRVQPLLNVKLNNFSAVGSNTKTVGIFPSFCQNKTNTSQPCFVFFSFTFYYWLPFRVLVLFSFLFICIFALCWQKFNSLDQKKRRLTKQTKTNKNFDL